MPNKPSPETDARTERTKEHEDGRGALRLAPGDQRDNEAPREPLEPRDPWDPREPRDPRERGPPSTAANGIESSHVGTWRGAAENTGDHILLNGQRRKSRSRDVSPLATLH